MRWKCWNVNTSHGTQEQAANERKSRRDLSATRSGNTEYEGYNRECNSVRIPLIFYKYEYFIFEWKGQSNETLWSNYYKRNWTNYAYFAGRLFKLVLNYLVVMIQFSVLIISYNNLIWAVSWLCTSFIFAILWAVPSNAGRFQQWLYVRETSVWRWTFWSL